MADHKGLLESCTVLRISAMVRYERWGVSPHVPVRYSLTPRQFQQQVPGNIIPLPAFVRQMADTTIDGAPAVSAKVISFWQGFAEMAKTLGMFTGGTLMNYFGRK